MSFILSEEKYDKIKKIYPIARLKTKIPLKYLYYIEDRVQKIDDKFLLGLSEDDKEIISRSIESQDEPENERLEKIYYDVLNKIKNTRKRYITPQGKRLELLPDFNRIEKLYIAAPSGAGKSTFASNWIRRYLEFYKDNEFIVLSCVDSDIVIDKLQPLRVNLNNVLSDPIDIENEMSNSIVLIDDCSCITNVHIRKYVINLLNSIAQTGRHYKITLVNVVHNLLDFHNSKTILTEATSVVIFCKSGSNKQNISYMERYCNFTKEQITKILNLPSRWVSIKRTFPNLIIHERGAYLS